MMNVAMEATYYRAALFLGLIQGEEVHRWAERVIERELAPPQAVLDVVSIPPGDLSAIRYALWPLVLEPEPPAVLRAMFALLNADLESGRRGLADTLTVLRQMRSMLRLPAEVYAELNAVLVEQASAQTAVTIWLQRFAKAHLALLSPN